MCQTITWSQTREPTGNRTGKYVICNLGQGSREPMALNVKGKTSYIMQNNVIYCVSYNKLFVNYLILYYYFIQYYSI